MSPTEINNVIGRELQCPWPEDPSKLASRLEHALNMAIGTTLADLSDVSQCVDTVWVHYGPDNNRVKVDVHFNNGSQHIYNWTDRTKFEQAA